MKLIDAEKVKRVMKDYWKAQVDKALILTFIDGNEADKRINSYLEHNHELLKAIDELPSAEPYTTTHDSIPAETGKNDGDGISGDCIGRTQTIDALRDYLVEKRCPDDGTLTCRLIENEVINKLPSVQPERKTGHWILDRSGAYCCSNCMEPCASYAMMKPRDRYCKMCGSRNEVAE